MRNKMNNKKTNRILINFSMLLVICLLILSGCDNNNGRKAARKITGTKAININIEGNNKIELYGNYITQEVYQITLENNGRYDIKNNEIYTEVLFEDGLVITDDHSVGSFEDEYDSDQNSNKIVSTTLSDFNTLNTIMLEGLNQIREKPDSITRIIGAKTNVPSGQGITSGIKVKSCYKYKTYFSETLCIDTIKNGKHTTCPKNEYNYNNGQGAPIKISKVIISDKIINENQIAPRLIITIENSQKNIATLPDNFIGACTSNGEINKIKLETAKIGMQELSCNTKENIIDLSSGKATIICDLDDNSNIEQGGEFTSVLQLVLSYGYSTSKDFEINIQRK